MVPLNILFAFLSFVITPPLKAHLQVQPALQVIPSYPDIYRAACPVVQNAGLHIHNKNPPKLSKRAKNSKGEVEFVITKCETKEHGFCKDVDNSMKRITQLLSRQIHFPAGLKIETRVDGSFFADNQTLAVAISTNYHQLSFNFTDNRFLYPQALAKQLYKNAPYMAEPEFEPFDIEVIVNAKAMNMIQFEGSSGTIVHDGDYILFHEIMHGLGFYCTFGLHLKEYDQNNKLVIPEVKFYGAGNRQIATSKLGIFDKYVYLPELNMSLHDLFSKFEPFTKGKWERLGPKLWLQNFKAQKELYELFEKVTQQINIPGKVVLRIPLADNMGKVKSHDCTLSSSQCMDIALYAAEGFVQGSSLSHFLNCYDVTSDYLMAAHAPAGKSLSQLVKEFGSPLGGGVLSLLFSMGYQPGADANICFSVGTLAR